MNTASQTLLCVSPAESEAQPHFRVLRSAVEQLTARLRERYEAAFPGRTQLVRRALADAEEQAWETAFPHLFLPELAEARVAELAHAPALSRAA